MKRVTDTWMCSNEKARGVARCPSPLEVKPPKMSTDIKDFTDKKQARLIAGFHCLGANTVSIYTTASGASGAIVSLDKSSLLSALTFNATDVTTNLAYGNASGKTLATSSSSDAVDLSTLSVSFFTQAIENIATLRAENGGSVSRLNFALEQSNRTKANLEAANGRIMDVDIAAESTRLAKYNILVQASASMLAQANVTPNMALMLIG